MAKIDKQISKLLNQGLSGSAIAKRLHKRKQTVLNAIREIQNKPKNEHKITNLAGKAGSVALDYNSKSFVDALYSEGYSERFIAQLVNHQHPETSKYKIRQYLSQLKQNPDAVKRHKQVQADLRKLGKTYMREREEGRYYRETETFYLHPIDWALYREG